MPEPHAYTPEELSPLQRVYLGVLATGIVPARLAGDESLRMDYLTAVCLALVEGQPVSAYTVGGGPAITPDFRAALTAAVIDLHEKRVLSAGAPVDETILSTDAAIVRPRPPAVIDFDQHPRLFDRFLAQQCMEALFSNPAVYPFLMGKYQDSGEVWGRLYRRGYGR